MLIPTCFVWLGIVVKTRTEMEGYIVGGELAQIENYPHSAFLSVNCVKMDYVREGWVCGASILNQKILLTAAHCLYSCSHYSHIGVNLGNKNRDKGQILSTYSFVVHENYNPVLTENDLALLSVEDPMILNKRASRVALMKKPPYNEPAVVAGWGVIDEKLLEQTNVLKYVYKQVLNRNDCLRILKFLPRGTICAAAKNKQEYASVGDSGSALLVRGYIQIGLVSFKYPTISQNIVVFTDVGYFYDWIRKYAKELNCITE